MPGRMSAPDGNVYELMSGPKPPLKPAVLLSS